MAALNRSRVSGVVRPPGDKSISHRALILSTLATGPSRVTNILDSADVRSTAGVLRALGADIPFLTSSFVVRGVGTRGLHSPSAELDCGNSGTTARLMAGVVAGAALNGTFVGDASLSRRPMARVADPLRLMGAAVDLAPHGGLPMRIHGTTLRSVEWTSPVASAQVKSAILLAALTSGVAARIGEPQPSRDHTERMLQSRGVRLRRSDHGATVAIDAGQTLDANDVDVPADPSSGAFFVALGLLSDDGEICVERVCLNPTRTGFLDVARRMGGDIDIRNTRDENGELVGDIVARPSPLRGISISETEVPSLIDELPLFACLAARAQGNSEVRGAGELRVKESDRIRTVVANLQAVGATAEELEDGFRISGAERPLAGRVVTHGDHRIAMAFGVLNAISADQIEVDDPDCVNVSFPTFWDDLRRVTA